MSAVTNQVSTKLSNGTIENISATTSGKIFTVDAVNSLPSEIGQAYITSQTITSSNSNSNNSWLDNLHDFLNEDS